jgi:hypothetical protein
MHDIPEDILTDHAVTLARSAAQAPVFTRRYVNCFTLWYLDAGTAMN